MKRFFSGYFVLPLIILAVCGCAVAQGQTLTVTGGEAVTYQCGNGEQIVARYYALSDKSLDFVKLLMPDGKECTLPQVLSGSGVRYSDDRELVWWTKGASAFSEVRDQNGEWQVQYDNCMESGR